MMVYCDGNKAQEDIQNGLNYDLAIIDRSLEKSTERITGDDLIRLSKKYYPSVPIICTSAYADMPDYADRLLTKPFDYGTLISSIEDCLASQSDKDLVREGKKKSPWAVVHDW